MNKERVIEIAIDAGKGAVDELDWIVAFAQAIRNEALGEAAAICRTEIQAGIKKNDGQWMVCADLIRAKVLELKEQQ